MAKGRILRDAQRTTATGQWALRRTDWLVEPTIQLGEGVPTSGPDHDEGRPSTAFDEHLRGRASHDLGQDGYLAQAGTRLGEPTVQMRGRGVSAGCDMVVCPALPVWQRVDRIREDRNNLLGGDGWWRG